MRACLGVADCLGDFFRRMADRHRFRPHEAAGKSERFLVSGIDGERFGITNQMQQAQPG